MVGEPGTTEPSMLSSAALSAITDVAAYIAERNAETNAQAAAEGWTFWTTIPTDTDFVGRFATAYDLELMYAQSAWFECYRDVRGYKPWGGAPDTLDACNAAIDALHEEWEAGAEEREAERLEQEAWEAEYHAREEAAEEARIVAAADADEDALWAIQDRLMGIRAA